MKKLFVMGVIYLLCTISGFSQVRSFKLLQEGINSNDYVKINKAISKGAVFFDDDLTRAIHENKLDLAKFMIGKGVTPTNGLVISAKENNLEILNLMLTLKSELSSEKNDIDGSVFMVSSKTKQQVPITIKTNSIGEAHYVADSLVVDFLIATVKAGSSVRKGDGFYFKYKTKKIIVGSSAMYFAISNKNPQMVKSLLSKGYDINNPILIKDFEEFRGSGIMSAEAISTLLNNGGTLNLNNGTIWAKKDSEGYIITSMMPIPAIKTTTKEYAKTIGDNEIISILSNGK